MRKEVVARLIFLFCIYVKFYFSRYRKTSRYVDRTPCRHRTVPASSPPLSGAAVPASAPPLSGATAPASAAAPPLSGPAVPASAAAPPLSGAAVPASAAAPLCSHCSAGGVVFAAAVLMW